MFTQHALPAIRPVNRIVHDSDIVAHTHQGAALAAHVQGSTVDPGVVVAYEANAIDPDTHLGWSVVGVGYARLVTDPAELDDYRGRLQPWVDQAMDFAVRIYPEVITGRRLTV
ncbi:hypothetical protein ABH925_006087 [Streptacidiphilus sp. EB129]